MIDYTFVSSIRGFTMIDYTFVSSIRGQGRIRTAEAARQQIYSLPVLTTYLPTRSFSLHYRLLDVTRTGFKPVTF